MIAARGSLRISAFGGLRSGLTAFRFEAKTIASNGGQGRRGVLL